MLRSVGPQRWGRVGKVSATAARPMPRALCSAAEGARLAIVQSAAHLRAASGATLSAPKEPQQPPSSRWARCRPRATVGAPLDQLPSCAPTKSRPPSHLSLEVDQSGGWQRANISTPASHWRQLAALRPFRPHYPTSRPLFSPFSPFKVAAFKFASSPL